MDQSGAFRICRRPLLKIPSLDGHLNESNTELRRRGAPHVGPIVAAIRRKLPAPGDRFRADQRALWNGGSWPDCVFSRLGTFTARNLA
jgi:hypothetical protein